MSRTRSCLNDAVAESWCTSPLVHRQNDRSRAEGRTAIFAWIAWVQMVAAAIRQRPPIPFEGEHQHATINPLPSTMAANPGIHP